MRYLNAKVTINNQPTELKVLVDGDNPSDLELLEAYTKAGENVWSGDDIVDELGEELEAEILEQVSVAYMEELQEEAMYRQEYEREKEQERWTNQAKIDGAL